jgi:histidinol dehydrogenase
MPPTELPIPVLAGDAAAAWMESARRPRASGEVRRSVGEIIEQVRREGDDALLEFAERFEAGRPESILVPRDVCRAALRELSSERRGALELAVRNLTRFHQSQVREEPPVDILPGILAWREFRPIDRVGVYAPGGRAAYPSSVLMAVVPARIAGVREIAVCCPAGSDGRPPASVMAACALLGVDELFAIGGAQAMAALALGTETVRPVDKIVGPGGSWVNEAKLALFSEVAIDLPAGPSEVVIWADSSADPKLIAAELVAQAEHGPDSFSVAVLSDTDSDEAEEILGSMARETAREVVRSIAALASLPGAESSVEAATASLAGSAILVAPSDEEAASWVNALAGEHLALLRREPRGDLVRIDHAGSVFLGPWAPVAAGDYASGTNHVLPTGRRARAASGLGVDDFGRWIQVQEIDAEGLRAIGPAIATLAEWEGLPAHAAAVRARFTRDPEEER